MLKSMSKMNKFNSKFLSLMLIVFFTSSALAVSRSNNTLKNNNIVKQKTSDHTAEPRGYEPWYMDGYGHDAGAYGKTDYYWLIPLVIVIGFGALLIPLLGTLMTTMITQGTINLTAGRRKRSAQNERLEMPNTGNTIPEFMIGLLAKVENALEKFGNQIKSDVSSFKSRLETKNL